MSTGSNKDCSSIMLVTQGVSSGVWRKAGSATWCRSARVVAGLKLLLAVNGCGFQFRGGVDLTQAKPVGTVFVDPQQHVTIDERLREALLERDIQTTLIRDQAEVLFWLANEVEDRRVLSVDSTGRVSEYELRLSIDMLLVQSEDGLPPVYRAEQKPNRVEVLRELTHEESAILGKADEEEILREEMRDELVRHLLLRMEATVSVAGAQHQPLSTQ